MDIEKVFTYQQPTSEDVSNLVMLRHTALTLAKMIENCCPESIEKNEAIKKVREAVMWANASIVLKG